MSQTQEKTTGVEMMPINIHKMQKGDFFTAAKKVIPSADPDSVRQYIGQLGDAEQAAEFILGGLLKRVRDEELYSDEYETFAEYCESVLGYRKQKAAAMIKIYTILEESDIEWEDVKDLHWSRLKVLAPALTRKNVKKVVKKVLKENMNVPTCKEYSVMLMDKKSATNDAEPGESEPDTNSEDETVKKRQTVSFQMYEDQVETINNAIDEYRSQYPDCGSDAVALENICLQFLSGDFNGVSSDDDVLIAPQQPVELEDLISEADVNTLRAILEEEHPAIFDDPSLVKLMDKEGIEVAVDAFNAAFPEANLTLAVPDADSLF